ncbi:hypothetical protein BBI17_002936 [Phytophthora kernoviae]|uniref:Uncharacterized protein n=1 Tax=Phytophthora kernoviae TaxID=325452 RepID=A0A3R7K9J2_9STRA|nr:hypothetical protein JM18_005964 [Phytophthora kernoviae]RLN37952.1 hypothetical protein BBI17_002936 [Phytophthora kernoviae]
MFISLRCGGGGGGGGEVVIQAEGQKLALVEEGIRRAAAGRDGGVEARTLPGEEEHTLEEVGHTPAEVVAAGTDLDHIRLAVALGVGRTRVPFRDGRGEEVRGGLGTDGCGGAAGVRRGVAGVRRGVAEEDCGRAAVSVAANGEEGHGGPVKAGCGGGAVSASGTWGFL